jgi:hypothetical protein
MPSSNSTLTAPALRRRQHGAHVRAQWHVPKEDPSLRRRRVLERLEERAWRRGYDSIVIHEKVRETQADSDRLCIEIWQRHWATTYAVAVSWA